MPDQSIAKSLAGFLPHSSGSEPHDYLFVVMVIMVVVALFFGVGLVMLDALAKRVAKRVLADQGLRDQAAIARETQTARETMNDAIRRMSREVSEHMDTLTEHLRDNNIPLTIAVDSAEGRQILEAMITRTRPNVIVRTAARRSRAQIEDEMEHENAPTVWARILQDDDEEGTPCPKIEPELPKSPKPQKKSVPKRKGTRKATS